MFQFPPICLLLIHPKHSYERNYYLNLKNLFWKKYQISITNQQYIISAKAETYFTKKMNLADTFLIRVSQKTLHACRNNFRKEIFTTA